MLDSQQFGLVFIGRGAFSFSSPRPTSPHFGLPLTYFGHPEKRLLCRLLRTPKGSNSKTLGPRRNCVGFDTHPALTSAEQTQGTIRQNSLSFYHCG
jgi:hypothetical protein